MTEDLLKGAPKQMLSVNPFIFMYLRSFARFVSCTETSVVKIIKWLAYAPHLHFMTLDLCKTHLEPPAQIGFDLALSNTTHCYKSDITSSVLRQFLGDFLYI